MSSTNKIPIEEKCKTTKEEIAKLEKQLQSLIHYGTNPRNISSKPESKPMEEPVPKKQKVEGVQHVVHVSKNKVINVESKRQELEAKKQRLSELQQKAREIVNRNVQLKRERSKSRDRGIAVRPKSPNLPQTSQVQKQNLLLAPTKTVTIRHRSKSASAEVSPKLNTNVNTQQTKVCSRLSRSQTRPPVSMARSAEPRKKLPQKDKIIKPVPPKIIIENVETRVLTDENGKTLTSNKTPESTVLDKKLSQIGKDLEELKPATSHSKLVTTRDQDSQETYVRFQSKSLIEGKKEREEVARLRNINFPPFKNITLHKKRPEHDKIEKQTQTCNSKKFEGDLNVGVPYPYNFINTVKSKLLLSINSPKYTLDVGVQSSLLQDPAEKQPEPEVIAFQEIIARNSSSSNNFQSFESHHNKNLDLKTVEKLELIPGKNSNEKQSKGAVFSRLLFSPEGESESDTWKNIPEISSESNTSPQKLSSSLGSKLRLDRLEALKLTPSSKATKSKSVNSIESNSKSASSDYKSASNNSNHKTASSSDSYSSDFVTTSKSATNKSIPSMNERLNLFNGNNLLTIQSTPSAISNDPMDLLNGNINSSLMEKSFNIPSKKSRTTSRNDSVESSSTSISEKETTNSIKTSSLKEPPVSLNLKRGDSMDVELKFQDEVHLLKDYQKSLKQLTAVENAYEDYKRKNTETQTSFVEEVKPKTTPPSSINLSRGSDIIIEEMDTIRTNESQKNIINNSSLVTSVGWDDLSSATLNISDLSSATRDNETDLRFSLSNVDNNSAWNVCAGLSVQMFDQLIKEEDARIAQLKANLSIRHQALLSRTKAELTLLEIQRKQLTETGRLEEASVIRKKQRGILLKHQQENNEIKRLIVTKKGELKQKKQKLERQRDLIKTQLTNKTNCLTNIQVTTPKKKRNHSGPLVVIQNSSSAHSDVSVALTDTTISALEESVLARISETDINNLNGMLSMREKALKERRKCVEDLLRWHQRLRHDEKQIVRLEGIARAILKKEQAKKIAESAISAASSEEPHESIESNVTTTADIPESLVSGGGDGSSAKKTSEIVSDKSVSEVIEEIKTASNKSEYSTVFEAESEDIDEESNISSIADLINNFSRIEDDLTGFDMTPGQVAIEENNVLSDSGAPSEITITNAEEEEDENRSKSSHEEVEEPSSEIPTDTNNVDGDKSPPVPEVVPPTSPESIASIEQPSEVSSSRNDEDLEDKDLLKEQLIAIEQEINHINIKLQQKEQVPYVFMREIPNKPPPPYMPTSSISSPTRNATLPSDPKDVDEITKYTSKVLFKAYQMNNLANVKFSVNSFKLMSNLDIPTNCCEYLFNLSRDVAMEHYNQFKTVEDEPSWLELEKKNQLSTVKPLDGPGLEALLNDRLKELLGFSKTERSEGIISKCGRKKRDHVDEVLVQEQREQDSEWTDLEKNELHVKDQIVNDIMKSMIADTARALIKIREKRKAES